MQDSILKKLAPPLLIVIVGLGAYGNSFQGVFFFDDFKDISNNYRVHHLGTSWAPSPGLWRPVAWFSLAVNYALGEDKAWGYHAFNVSVHLLAGLTLFGIMRRTLLLEPYRPRWQCSAPWLAMIVAILWLVHPLQTESVTYIVHRYESLMGLFYLLTLYCVIRGATAASPSPSLTLPARAPLRVKNYYVALWYTAAFFFCALGMGSKEVMVTAPLMVLLYDRIFLSESWGRLFRARWPLYLGLAATWSVLLPALGTALTGKEGWAGFGSPELSARQYALNQPRVILHYLRLSFWPDPLCVDYIWPAAEGWEWLRPALVILALVLGSLVALWRRPWLGFLGAWFFVILAPTSSIMPIAELAAERRMYLSLAAVIVLVVLAGQAFLEKLSSIAGEKWVTVHVPLSKGDYRGFSLSGLAAAGLIAALAWTTIQRNRVYHNLEGMWRDVLSQRPANYRAHNYLGLVLLSQGNVEEAVEHFQESIRYGSWSPDPFNSLGMVKEQQGEVEEAAAWYRQALKRNPDYAHANHNLGKILMNQGRLQEAREHFGRALGNYPEFAEAYDSMGTVCCHLKLFEEAQRHYAAALRLKPKMAVTHSNLGNLFYQVGQPDEAIWEYRKALEIDPAQLEAHINLGLLFAENSRFDEAAAMTQAALDLAQARGQMQLAEQIKQHLARYRQKMAQPAPSPGP